VSRPLLASSVLSSATLSFSISILGLFTLLWIGWNWTEKFWTGEFWFWREIGGFGFPCCQNGVASFAGSSLSSSRPKKSIKFHFFANFYRFPALIETKSFNFKLFTQLYYKFWQFWYKLWQNAIICFFSYILMVKYFNVVCPKYDFKISTFTMLKC
jgi:hypothetical protein